MRIDNSFEGDIAFMIWLNENLKDWQLENSQEIEFIWRAFLAGGKK